MFSETAQTRSIAGPIFRAYTVKFNESERPSSVIPRTMLEELFQQRQWVGSNVIISGPAGSGKSVLALSAALSRFDSVQYICARDVPEILQLDLAPAGDGKPVADLFNHLMLTYRPEAEAQVRTFIEEVRSSAVPNRTLFVMDDLDLLPALNPDNVRKMISQGVTVLSEATIVMVTRSSYERVVEFIGNTSQTRVISANLLKISRNELCDLVNHRTFGEVSPFDVEQAWRHSGGWFAGMEFGLGSSSQNVRAIDDFVLNEILIRLPRTTGLVVFALSKFPHFSSELVEHLFRELGENLDPLLFSQLPLVDDPSASDAEEFRFPELLKQSLDRLVRMIDSQSIVRDLQVAGVSWFLNRDSYDDAKVLATAANVESDYLNLVHPICAGLADQEAWMELRTLLEGVPIEYVENDPDLAFWMMFIELYSGNVKALSKLRWARDPEGKLLSDPKQKARAKLMLAWRLWSQSQPEESLKQSEQAFELFPENALQERMFAAIAAEMAARNLGDQNKVDVWTKLSSTNRPAGALRQEFWHRNVGYHRVGHIALSGKLTNALDFADMFRSQIDTSYRRGPFSYHMLSSYIQIEQLDMAAAKHHLLESEQFSDSVVTGNQLSLLRASFAMVTGDLAEARIASRVDGPDVKSRSDYYFHRLRLLAEIELAANNIDMASDIIENWCGGETSWPKHFGEPNLFLVKAKVLASLGDFRRASTTAQYVINESRRRGHLSFLIAALAIQAECHHSAGRSEKRDGVIRAAKGAAGTEPFNKSFAPLGRDIRTLAKEEVHAAAKHHDLVSTGQQRPSALTARETELLMAAAEGLSNRKIGEQHFISQYTVKNHFTSIFRKLGVNNRKDAIDLVFPLYRHR